MLLSLILSNSPSSKVCYCIHECYGYVHNRPSLLTDDSQDNKQVSEGNCICVFFLTLGNANKGLEKKRYGVAGTSRD